MGKLVIEESENAADFTPITRLLNYQIGTRNEEADHFEAASIWRQRAEKLRSPEFELTHSPRPAVRYRPLLTCLLCRVSFETSQSAIFNQLALKLGLRAHHQPGKSVNISGLLFWPRTSPVLLNQQFAIDPCQPSSLPASAFVQLMPFPAPAVSAWPCDRDLTWIPVLATNRENV